ncbi:MAG: TlpA family protein disulfide reductase [Myxococcaceae bacterium]|nr:TlpA family protein disulfide reductase [Myxococcaceae bacterium]
MINRAWLVLWLLGVVLVTSRAEAEAPLPGGITRVTPPRPLPDFRIIDSEGRELGPKELAGRIVVLNLWATWCGPCVHEMPSLERLQTALGSEKLAVIAVSLDREGRRAVERFRASTGLKVLKSYYDPRGRTGEVLGASGLPLTLILNTQGEEIARATGSLDWSSPEVLAYLRGLIDTGNGRPQPRAPPR